MTSARSVADQFEYAERMMKLANKKGRSVQLARNALDRYFELVEEFLDDNPLPLFADNPKHSSRKT